MTLIRVLSGPLESATLAHNVREVVVVVASISFGEAWI